jgi:uncharacterized protein
VSVLRRGVPWAALLVLSFALAELLDWAGFPAAFLLAAMISAIGLALRGVKLQIPRPAIFCAQGIIGCLVGRTVTLAILTTMAADWATMLLVVSSTVLAGAIVGWVMARYGALPGTTAAWGSSPGGASAMIVMAAEYGADVRLVALMQYLRVIVVVVSASLVSRLLLGAEAAAAPVAAGSGSLVAVPLVPFLETLVIAIGGALIGWRVKLPGGPILIPTFISALLHVTGAVTIVLPPLLLHATYFLLGWYVGLGFSRDVIAYALRAIPQLLVASVMLIGLCGLSAWLLTLLLRIDALTAYLATSPGGLDSVTIIAIGSHADIAFVLAVQTLRLFVVMVTGPQIAKLICRYA